VVLDEHQRVLLETRPPSGIWGGLSSLPELTLDANPLAWLQQRLNCQVGAVLPAPTWTHTFSHFRLHITPVLCQVRQVTVAMEPGWYWLPLEDQADAALPAPVKKILDALSSAE
jgi:A/G-specific adenine glycosylase